MLRLCREIPDRQIPDRTTSNGPEMASGIRVFGSETANSTSMPIDVEFGVLIRISQIPDRVRKPRIRSSKGFLDESIQNQDLEWHLEWYLGWYLEFPDGFPDIRISGRISGYPDFRKIWKMFENRRI